MSMRSAVTTPSGGLGLVAGRTGLQSTMNKLISIIVLGYCILEVTGISNPVIGKCCPDGQVISVSKNFTCSFAGDHSREIYQFQGHASFETFSTCPKTGIVTLTFLEDLVEPIVRANSACIDIMYDEEEDRSVPVIFWCATKGPSKGAAGTGSLAVPRLSTLRMCCGIDRVYDVGKRDCVFKQDGLNVPSNFKFLKENLEFVTVIRGAPPCKPAILDYVVNVTRDIRVLSDGTLEVVLATKNGSETIVANENNACLDPGTSGTPGLIVIRACSDEKFCEKNACVRKCCPEDQAMIGYKCEKIPSDLPPGYFHNILHNVSAKRSMRTEMDALQKSDYGMLIGKPCKHGTYLLEQYERWHITSMGHVHLPHYKVYGHDEYCMAMFFGDARLEDSIYPVVCFESPAAVYGWEIKSEITASLELISGFFLVVTLLVYICLPELRNLHGKTVMCHVASLIVNVACLASVKLGVPATDGIPGSEGTNICKLFGFMTLISWIAAFSWLNVMCFDIWWTFGGLGGPSTSGGRGRAYDKRFVTYSLYAWGVAIFVTCIALIADNTEFLSVYLRPNIGVTDCWFHEGPDLYGELIFFTGPMLIQQIANIIFFIMTARYCSGVKAEITRVMASPADPRSRRYQADRTNYMMNIKLFAVMDVVVMVDVICYVFERYGVAPDWRAQFFYVSEVYNDLRGFIIFVLFVLKPKIYYDLLKRLGGGSTSNTPPIDGAILRCRILNGLQNPQGEKQGQEQHAHIELACQRISFSHRVDKK